MNWIRFINWSLFNELVIIIGFDLEKENEVSLPLLSWLRFITYIALILTYCYLVLLIFYKRICVESSKCVRQGVRTALPLVEGALVVHSYKWLHVWRLEKVSWRVPLEKTGDLWQESPVALYFVCSTLPCVTFLTAQLFHFLI